MTRDQHRQRVYDSEEAAFGGTHLTEPLGWDDVVATFHAVLHHPWWRATGAGSPTLVKARADSGRSSSNGVQVRLCAGGQDALTIAHELAHHLVLAGSGTPPVAPHGPEFCAALSRLVQLLGGSAARNTLLAELAARDVPVAPWWHPEPPSVAPLADSLVAAGPGRVRGAVVLPPVVPRRRLDQD